MGTVEVRCMSSCMLEIALLDLPRPQTGKQAGQLPEQGGTGQDGKAATTPCLLLVFRTPLPCFVVLPGLALLGEVILCFVLFQV